MAFIALGTLLFCPTPMQLILFAVLTIIYVRLARKEDRELEKKFGEEFQAYKKAVGRFLPGLQSRAAARPT